MNDALAGNSTGLRRRRMALAAATDLHGEVGEVESSQAIAVVGGFAWEGRDYSDDAAPRSAT